MELIGFDVLQPSKLSFKERKQRVGTRDIVLGTEVKIVPIPFRIKIGNVIGLEFLGSGRWLDVFWL